jgi:hypothetical protein
MKLKEIMAIAGKPGLYKMVAQAKNGIIVESIIDQKRVQAFTQDKISTLEEISVYTEDGDKPLREIFQKIMTAQEGKATPDFKGNNNKIKEFFGQVLPEYDKERVYTSHMQKIVSWYNLLIQHDLAEILKNDENEETSANEGNEADSPGSDESNDA